MSDMSDIVGRIRYLRKQLFGRRGRAKFAKTLGVSESTYSDWERGRVPRADDVARIAQATACSCEWLLSGEGTPFRRNQVVEPAPETRIPIRFEGELVIGGLDPDALVAAMRKSFKDAGREVHARLESVLNALSEAVGVPEEPEPVHDAGDAHAGRDEHGNHHQPVDQQTAVNQHVAEHCA